MKRCAVQDKRKFRDVGHAARFIKPGEWQRPYLCRYCGSWHLTTQAKRDAA